MESNETVNNKQKQKPYQEKNKEQTLDISDLLIENALLLTEDADYAAGDNLPLGG